MAESVSLSPNLISYKMAWVNTRFGRSSEEITIHTLTEIVSFSFTIGTTPIDSSSDRVFTAFR